MKKINQLLFVIFIAIELLHTWGCNRDVNSPSETGANSSDSIPVRGDWIRVFLPADPASLNPFLRASLYADQIGDLLFYSLTTYDPKTLAQLPQLAKSLPDSKDNHQTLIYELRTEGKWDNGKPITSRDVLFSFKVAVHPHPENFRMRQDLDFLNEVEIDSNNPSKIIFRLKYPYFKAESSLGAVPIVQEEFYDPAGFLKNSNVEEIQNAPEEFLNHPVAKKFDPFFEDIEYSQDPGFMSGTGPYAIEEWLTNSRIILKRKQNWWGDSLCLQNPHFAAWPEKIIFKIFPDRNSAVAALRSGELDLMNDIPPSIFYEAMTNGGFIKDNFKLILQDSWTYNYLAMNSRPAAGRTTLFCDKYVRKAMAHLIDVEQEIANTYYGLANRVLGPISPLKVEEVNPDAKPVHFDPELAKELLSLAGWNDSDYDQILDKFENGKKVSFIAELLFPAGNKNAESMALRIQKSCKDAGIKIELKGLAFGALNDRTRAHDFDLCLTGVSGNHLPTSFMQMWHTDSWTSGDLNISGFGTAETDALIEKIQKIYDAKERKVFCLQLQEIIQEEQPVVFLIGGKERIAIHKRFHGAAENKIRPHYNPAMLWVAVGEQKFK